MAIGEIPVAVLFFAHVVIRNLSGGMRVFTDESHQNATCPEEGGFSRTSDSNDQLVRWKAGFHGRSCLPAPHLHAGNDLHDE